VLIDGGGGSGDREAEVISSHQYLLLNLSPSDQL
jgi:hypothetical protein